MDRYLRLSFGEETGRHDLILTTYYFPFPQSHTLALYSRFISFVMSSLATTAFSVTKYAACQTSLLVLPIAIKVTFTSAHVLLMALNKLTEDPDASPMAVKVFTANKGYFENVAKDITGLTGKVDLEYSKNTAKDTGNKIVESDTFKSIARSVNGKSS